MQAYADKGTVQRQHLLAEDFLAPLTWQAQRIAERGIGRDVSTAELLALMRLISTLMRRHGSCCFCR